MQDTARPTIVLLHGAWHGPWCWDKLRVALHTSGWETTAPRLRSVPLTATRPTAGLHDDVAALLDHVEHIDGPVALVAHSYAGMPATELAAMHPDKVSQLIYVAAYVPTAGDSLFSIHGMAIPEDVTGTVPVPDDPITMFYADVDRATASAAAARLKPQSLRSWTERVDHVDVRPPTTYLLCQNDQALPTPMQEVFAAQTSRVERLDSGHSPFLSQPQKLAALLEQVFLSEGRPSPVPAASAAAG
jgi:pimeloyl-ACP methyl ester carboxylesterase